MGIINRFIQSSKKSAMVSSFLLLGLATACGGSSSSNGGGDITYTLTPQNTAAVGVEIPILEADHVDEGVKVEYNSTPPTSGEHWPRWADCGFYTENLPDERIVHNLEHGNIVVNYSFTNPAQVTELREVLEVVPEFADWGIARSYHDIPDGQVAIAAWGRLNFMEGVRPGEIEFFFSSWAGILGPERVTC